MSPSLIPAVCLCSLSLLGSAAAQIAFTDRSDLLPAGNFNSGAPMAVADMNGDGLDDIVRLPEKASLAIAYQSTPRAPFDHSYPLPGDLLQDVWTVAVADADGDGRNDLLLGDAASGMVFLRATGGGAFTGSRLPNRDIFPQGSVFADLDNDGLLDVFACDDDDDPHKYRGFGDGWFADSALLLPTQISGSAAGEPQSGNYAALWTDYDGDGRCDLYLSKCRQGASSAADPRRINRLFDRGIDGVFTERALAAGLADGGQTWCTDFADIDNDGDLDSFILNHGSGASRLMRNNGNGTFTDITSAAGLGGHLDLYGIQAAFRDFDNDGYVDLLLTSTELGGLNATYRLFRNNGNATFARLSDVFAENGGIPVDSLHSVATGDLDHDGFVDIYAGRGTLFNSPSSLGDLLFLNDGNANHFLAVRLVGTASNRSAVGARIELTGPWGTQVREVRGGEGYGVCSSHTQHFGLGAASVAPLLRVRWPSGLVDEIANVAGDQFLTVTEGETLGAADFSAPAITSSATVAAKLFEPIAYQIRGSNVPTHFALDAAAPAGMAIHPTSGVLTWTPTAAGNVVARVTASNPAGSVSQDVQISVAGNDLA